MKYFLIFLFLTTNFLQAQSDKLSNVFIDLAEIEEPPTYIGCENEESKTCSFNEISSYFIEHANPDIISAIAPEERIVHLKFIVDSFGKVRRTMAQAKNEDLKKEANRILKTLPNFNPGVHKGEKVNVIMDLFLDLPIMETFNINSEALESKPIVFKCKDVEDPTKCTSQWVQNYVNLNFNMSKIKTKGVNLESIIHFVVDENGKVTEVVAKGNDQEMNKEGVRIINQLPDFIPAKKDNKNVRVSLSFPIKVFVAK